MSMNQNLNSYFHENISPIENNEFKCMNFVHFSAQKAIHRNKHYFD